MITSSEFWNHIELQGDIVDDPAVQHHELSSGIHGIKIDMDKILEGTPLFDEWVSLVSEAICEGAIRRNVGRLAIVSVANGTNRLVPHIVGQVWRDIECFSLLTEKVSSDAVALTAIAKQKVERSSFTHAVFVEDAGTTGATTLTAIRSAQEVMDVDMWALMSIQRHEQLTALDDAGVVYEHVMRREFPEFASADCQEFGLCAQGIKCISKNRY